SFKRLKNATQDLLADYKAYSGVDLKVEFADPISGLTGPDRDTVISNLYQLGVEPTTLNIKNNDGFAQKVIFPMAIVETGDKHIPVKLLHNLDASGSYEQNINSSIENLEYVFTSAIQKLLSGDRPRIGFTEGNGELSDAHLSDALKSLSESYEAGRVNLDVIDKAGLDKLKLMIVAKPQKAFTEAQKYKLNYFVMNGGRLVWCIDQSSADLDSMARSGEQLTVNRSLNLDDMLFIYGARVNYNILADANCAEIPVNMGGQDGEIQMAPWVFYPLLMPDTANSLVRNLDGVRSEFASTVDTIGVRGIVKKSLLQSSAFNKIHSTPKLLSLQMVSEQPDPKSYASVPQMVGVLLEGSFPSVFMNRAVPAGVSGDYIVPLQSKNNRMIVIGDGDVFKNQVSSRDGSVFPLGFDRYMQRNYGNKALLLNIADYMTNDRDLIALRNKEVKIRVLDKTV
ncbi:MAG: gliding motility-associated ABC transporter substrate-binding protein GldG, partial [Pedobacter sp.]